MFQFVDSGFYIVGIKLLGDAFKDPFGADVEDQPVLGYVAGTTDACRRLLLAQPPAKQQTSDKFSTEANIVRSESMRPGLGKGFDVSNVKV